MSGILRSMLGGLGTGMANVGKEMYADAAATDLTKLRAQIEAERDQQLQKYRSGERAADQEFRTNERISGQEFTAEQKRLDRESAERRASKDRKDKAQLVAGDDNQYYRVSSEGPAAPVELEGGGRLFKDSTDKDAKERERLLTLRSQLIMEKSKGGDPNVIDPEISSVEAQLGKLADTRKTSKTLTSMFGNVEGGASAGGIIGESINGGGATEQPKEQKSGPVRISTDEEYSALPPGTLYISPDGKTRTKR